jgi:nucleotide-binding universal stress UspA family protein
MKILFGTDGSPCALAALKSLAERLGWFRDPVELTVINVHPPVPYKRAAAWAGNDALERYYDEEGNAVLEPAAEELTRRGITHRIEKRVGEPAPTIVAAAEEGRFDLIALGTQGHSALENLMLGSVAIKVLAHASTPVLLLR